MKTFLLVSVLTILGALPPLASAAPGSAKTRAFRRVALIVGANGAAPGRKPLRFAYRDAQNVAATLRDGGVEIQDLHVLEDPDPIALLHSLDSILSELASSEEESLLIFYYSGHADAQALYPNGKSLALSELRTRLDNSTATVRLGIIDACRGGGWTGTKGLTETETFAVNLPLNLSNEGSALISSSSGLEDAHESEQLQGSFFTHHWNAALRGAGDEDQDGIVTLTEAFGYAKALTIRDTAMHTETPQHPSFQLNLKGRQALALANLHAGKSVLTVEQKQGPMQLVHLDTGLVILELPAGQRKMRLVVPPGRYLVRRQSDQGAAVREIRVKLGSIAYVREEQLELVGTEKLIAKNFVLERKSTLRAGQWRMATALGVRHHTSFDAGLGIASNGSKVATSFAFSRGITDRLEWVVPTIGFAYRGGEAGDFEWIPWGGLIGWGVGYSSVEGGIFEGNIGAGIDTRWWQSKRTSLNFSFGVASRFRYSSKPVLTASGWIAPKTWRNKISVGYSYAVEDVVTLNVALGLGRNFLAEGELPPLGWSDNDQRVAVSIGSTQARALRQLPLVQIHLRDDLSLDGHVIISISPEHRVAETYMLGVTRTW